MKYSPLDSPSEEVNQGSSWSIFYPLSFVVKDSSLSLSLSLTHTHTHTHPYTLARAHISIVKETVSPQEKKLKHVKVACKVYDHVLAFAPLCNLQLATV